MVGRADGGLLIVVLLCSSPACSDKHPPRHEPGPAAIDMNVSQVASDLELVDDYLGKWDRFARGENDLVSHIRNHKDSFEAALSRLLNVKDKRAAGRLVFYAVVQVGGFIAVDSDLGKASAALLGPDFPVFTSKQGERSYFAGELYFWWLENRDTYDAYPLFEEWSQRDFAKTVAVPMYKAARKQK